MFILKNITLSFYLLISIFLIYSIFNFVHAETIKEETLIYRGNIAFDQKTDELISGIVVKKYENDENKEKGEYIEGLKDTPIVKQNQLIRGHEFHYWEIENNLSEFELRNAGHQNKLSSPWKIKSWDTEYKNEGFFDNKLHASWIHLHFSSSPKVAKNLVDATQIGYSKHS